MDAALTAVPGGIRVVWGAIRSTDTSDPNQDLNTALSTDGGASWQLTPGSIIPRGAQAYGSDASATTLPNGTVAAGVGGDARHVGALGARPGDAERRLPGAARSVRLQPGSPPTRAAGR